MNFEKSNSVKIRDFLGTSRCVFIGSMREKESLEIWIEVSRNSLEKMTSNPWFCGLSGIKDKVVKKTVLSKCIFFVFLVFFYIVISLVLLMQDIVIGLILMMQDFYHFHVIDVQYIFFVFTVTLFTDVIIL